MLKRILYIIMGILFILFVYFNYIRDSKPINPDDFGGRENIETDSVRYNINKDYQIEAEKQVDNKSDEKSYFSVAKALFKQLEISGNEAIVDQARNMILQGNIFGKSDTGWTFNTEVIEYDQGKKKFFSKSPVEAYSEEHKMKMTSDEFQANSEFTIITARDNVVLTSDTIHLTCDRVTYNRDKENLKLYNNIKFTAKNLETEKGVIDEISGELSYATYDLKREKLTVWGKFKIFYQGYTLNGNNMLYFNKTGNLNIYDKADIEKEDLKMDFEKAFFNNKTRKLVITGPIVGNKGTTDFKADFAEVEVDSENLKAYGNVKIETPDQEELIADNVYYEKDANKFTFKGKGTTKVILKGIDYEATTKEAVFYQGEEKLIIDGDYNYKGLEISSTGEKLEYNMKTGKGTTRKGYAQQGNTKIYSRFVDFDMKKKQHFLRKDIKVLSENYIIKTDKAVIEETEDKILINDVFEVENEKDKVNIKGKQGIFDNKDGIIYVKNGVEVYRDDQDIFGDKLTYDTKAKNGIVEDNVRVVNKKDNSVLNADKVNYDYQKKIELNGNVKYNREDYTFLSEKAIYNYELEKAIFDLPGRLENEKEQLDLKFETGEYDRVKGIFYANNFSGIRELAKFSSDNAEFNQNTNTFTMKGNAKVQRGEIKVTGEEVTYFHDNGDVVSELPFVISQKDMNVEIEKGRMNVRDKTLRGYNGLITTGAGDRLTGDYVDGSLDNKEFNFRENLKADLADGVKFGGELAKLFFIETEENNHQVTRGEIKNDATFKFNDMKLDSEFLELDNSKKLVFGKGTSMLKIQEDGVEHTYTDVTADYIFLDVEKQLGEMKNNVKLTNVTKELGKVNTTSDNASLDNVNKKIDLLGNVNVEKGTSSVIADSGTMNLLTNVLSGAGNIKFKYKLGENPVNKDEKKDDKKKESEDSIKVGEKTKEEESKTEEKIEDTESTNNEKSEETSEMDVNDQEEEIKFNDETVIEEESNENIEDNVESNDETIEKVEEVQENEELIENSSSDELYEQISN